MKIQLPTRNDVKDGATQLADEAKQAAADAASELGSRARELGAQATEAAKSVAAHAAVAVSDFGTDAETAARDFGHEGPLAARAAADDLTQIAEQAAKDAGTAAGDIGKGMAKGMAKGFHEAKSATGLVLHDAAGDIRNGTKRWIRVSGFRAPQVEVTDETRRRFDGLRAAVASGALSLGGRLAKTSGRAIVTRRTPIQRVGFAIPIVGVVIVAAGTGAVLAYAFDPVSGRARRAPARQQVNAGAHRVGRELGRARQLAISAVAGKLEQMRESRREITAEASGPLRSSAFEVPATRSAEMVGVMSGTAGNGLG